MKAVPSHESCRNSATSPQTDVLVGIPDKALLRIALEVEMKLEL
jgi:hypothetical protein